MGVAVKTYFYAVKYGRQTGVFICWDDCRAQVKGYVGARYKKFHVRKEAEDYAQGVVVLTAPFEAEVQAQSHAGPSTRAIRDNIQTVGDSTDTQDGYSPDSPKSTSRTLPSDTGKGKERAWDDEDWDWMSDIPSDVEDNYFTPLPELGKGKERARSEEIPTEAEDDRFPDPPLAPLPPKAGKGNERASNKGSVREPQRYEDLVVYCDGACKSNGTKWAQAGIGVWWGDNDKRNICERCPGSQTNNCAELVAIVRVLEQTSIDVKRRLVIRTDSDYARQCLTVWIKGWQNTGDTLYKKNGDPVANSELILYALALMECREKVGQQVKLEWIRGHAGDTGNEAADRLASIGASSNLDPKEAVNWRAKEQSYREYIRLGIESGEFYLRREGDVRVDVIGTSQEERELGGFQIESPRPRSSGIPSAHTGGENEPSSSQLILRPAGPLLQYSSDRSSDSGSPSPTEMYDSEVLAWAQAVMSHLRPKRANKPNPMPRNTHPSTQRSAANTQQDEMTESDLEAYALGMVDSDELENDLSD